MDAIARFTEYAAAFEDVYKSDDWTALERFFSEDAVYELTGADLFVGRHEGRDAVFAALKASLDRFDRRFETRQLEALEGPALRDGAVWMRWRASYRSPGVPELVIDGQESVFFEGDRIVRMVDDFPLEMGPITAYWFEQYGDRLPPAPA
jgi:hypothetical protein